MRKTKRITTALVGIVSLAVLASSCRSLVLEDRTPCPAFIRVEAVPPISPKTWERLGISIWEDGDRKEDHTVTAYELNRGYYIEAKKNSYFEASLLGGWPEEWMESDYLHIPEGNECPEGVGAYFGMEIGTDEIYYAPLELTYLYTNVVLRVRGASAGYDFKMTVDGAVDGFQYPGSGLHYGPFHAEAREVEYLRREVRIPRQVPFKEITRAGVVQETDALAALKADIFVKNEALGSFTHYLAIPLGKIISDSGYDWSTAQLEEIVVDLEMFEESIMSATVRIAGWTVILQGDEGITI